MLPSNPNAREFYVYVWWNDDDEEIFYVGKGTKNRYKDKCERNRWFNNIINVHKCHPEKIIENLTSDEALAAEARVEQLLRKNGVELVNATPCGGQPPTASGEDNPNFGHYWSDEKRQEVGRKMRESGCHAGDKNGRCCKCRIKETGDEFNSFKDMAENFFHTKSANVLSSFHQYGSYKGYHIEKI